jgi:hypothetical protein
MIIVYTPSDRIMMRATAGHSKYGGTEWCSEGCISKVDQFEDV